MFCLVARLTSGQQDAILRAMDLLGSSSVVRRLSRGQFARRVFQPPWRIRADDLLDLRTCSSAAEVMERAEARDLLQDHTASDPSRRYVSTDAQAGDLFSVEEGPPKDALRSLPPPKSSKEVLWGLLGGAVAGGILGLFAPQRGPQKDSALTRAIRGAFSGTAAVATRDTTVLQRALALPVMAQTRPHPATTLEALAMVALGTLRLEIETFARDAAHRLLGREPPIVVWHFLPRCDAADAWHGLGSLGRAEHVLNGWEALLSAAPPGWIESRQGLAFPPRGASAGHHAEFARRCANAADHLVAMGCLRDPRLPFAPLYEVWRRGCAVEHVSDAMAVILVRCPREDELLKEPSDVSL